MKLLGLLCMEGCFKIGHSSRNTDWSWMETTAFLFHDESGESVGRMPLQAGDDAKALKWIDISSEINLYASHKEFIEKAVYKLGAHW